MPGNGQCRRVDPTDIAVRTAINQVDSAVASVAEHHNGSAGHVELHHRVADRQRLQRGGCFRYDHRIELGRLVGFLARRFDDVARRIDRRRQIFRMAAIGARDMAIL